MLPLTGLPQHIPPPGVRFLKCCWLLCSSDLMVLITASNPSWLQNKGGACVACLVSITRPNLLCLQCKAPKFSSVDDAYTC